MARRPRSFARFFDGGQSEALITRWLAEEDKDKTIVEKDAAGELFKLIESRLGLPVPDNTSVTETREKLLRYVLVGELRSDLECDPPESAALVPKPPSKEYLDRLRDVAEGLRRGHAGSLPGTSPTRSKLTLALARPRSMPGHLGNIDHVPFRGKELSLHTPGNSSMPVNTRRRSESWPDASEASGSTAMLGRQAQWEACRLMGELGHEIEQVGLALGKSNGNPSQVGAGVLQ